MGLGFQTPRQGRPWLHKAMPCHPERSEGPMHSSSTIKSYSKLRLIITIAIAAIFSFPASPKVPKVVTSDTPEPIIKEYIARAIDGSPRRTAQAVLIEMNTPGGLV